MSTNKKQLKPKLSQNISFHELSKDSYFIHQSQHDHRIKIHKDLHDLLKKVDGSKTLEELSASTKLNHEDLYKILYFDLAKYGIIESDKISVICKKNPDYLKLSFIVIRPEFLSKITRKLKFLFRPKFAYVSLIFILIIIPGLGIISGYKSTFHSGLSPQDLLILFALSFIAVTFHEIGHAAASQNFGAKLGGIGGGFYLFTPVYFADVTDIWKLSPPKRIVVNLSGMYFELILCAIYIVIGLIFDVAILYISGWIISLRTLFNLNPFLRSDGYWILTDLSNVPNLHSASRNALYRTIKAIAKKNNHSINLKEFLLTIYASINYLLILVFLYYFVFVNENSILFFKQNILNLYNKILSNKSISLSDLKGILLPILFFYLLIKVTVSFLRNFLKKHLTNDIAHTST